MKIQHEADFAVHQRRRFHRFDGVVCPICVVATGRVSVEASSVDSLYVTGIVQIGGEPKGTPDRHLELLLPYVHGRKVRQLADIETHLLDDTVHLVKDIEEPSIWQVEGFPEIGNHNDDPVSVAAIALFDRWCRLTRNSAFCQRYETIRETRTWTANTPPTASDRVLVAESREVVVVVPRRPEYLLGVFAE